jgi:hypothetical protein
LDYEWRDWLREHFHRDGQRQRRSDVMQRRFLPEHFGGELGGVHLSKRLRADIIEQPDGGDRSE